MRMEAGLLIAAIAGVNTGFAQDYEVPRTRSGVPDLQGIWTSETLTNLERPDGVEDLVVAPEQAAAVERANAAQFEAVSDPEGTGAFEAGSNVGAYNEFWIDPGNRLAVINGEIRSSHIVDPPDGRVPYTAAGRQRLRELAALAQGRDGPEQRHLGDRCIVGYGSSGGPPMLPVLYNNNYQIVQSPGYVMILVEMNHDARIVRMGGEHLPVQVTPWLGDSIGWWEGDTLVVETTNVHPGQAYRPAIRHVLYVPGTATVTERFTRIADDEMLYEFSVSDPEAYTRTWRGEILFRASNEAIYEYACHEGNYALPGILGGARTEERAAAGEGESQ
ncbi:MAG TPA: hypothetical protein VIV14_13065 [Gammaproteobacteria bacterium]